MKTTIFKNFTHAGSNVSIESILQDIKEGQYSGMVEILRSLYKSGEFTEYKKKKKELAAFTPSGTFRKGRKKELLETYSGLLVIDFDNLNDFLPRVKKIINSDPYTFSCFNSPSNNGLKVFVKIDSTPETHGLAFRGVTTYYKQLTGVEADKSGSDITRLCFVSHDPELFINTKSETFPLHTRKNTMDTNMSDCIKTQNSVQLLIEKITENKIDITSSYEDWVRIAFALEDEFGDAGRELFHQISRYNPKYTPEECDKQYSACLNNNNDGIGIGTLFHIAAKYNVYTSNNSSQQKTISKKQIQKEMNTTNRFKIVKRYLSDHYDIRFNIISNKYEYKEKEEMEFNELNENTLYVKLREENISISNSDLLALLKSDFVKKFNPFLDYFTKLPAWDRKTDFIRLLTDCLKTPEQKRLYTQFKKWMVRAVKTALEDNYFNKQALIFVTEQQNSGKSTFCRFLCPKKLSEYFAENIGTDKDSLISLTENFLINLDELSTIGKYEINSLKSMFSKDKVKIRPPYEKRASTYPRRASIIGSTDRWEFLSDENGSVRWICFNITSIDWSYSEKINIDDVWAQAYAHYKSGKFDFELTPKEIQENEQFNRRYQISTPERDLIINHLETADSDTGEFMTSTEIVEYLQGITPIPLKSQTVGKELKFLRYRRVSVRSNKSETPRYGYYVKKLNSLF